MPEVARSGEKILTNTKNYRFALLKFYKQMDALNLQLADLNHHRALSMSVMKSIDEKISMTTQQVINSIKKIILSSETAVIILSILIIISLGLANTYINRSIINNPIQAILKVIESFKKGHFEKRIKLNRKDEWSIIEKAFNNMAAELSLSYSELEQRIKERTAELTATNQNLTLEIGERKRAEKRYRDLFDEAPVMYIITRAEDERPIIIDCNRMFLNTLGYNHKDVLNRPLEEFYTPESRFQLIDGGGYQDALEDRFNIQERQLLADDGHVIETVLQALPERDSDGKVYGTRAMFVDITARKRAEEALNTEKERLAVTLQSIGDGVITTGREGRITLVNRIAEELTGWSQSEATGLPLHQVFTIINEMTRQPCDDPVKHVIKSGKIVGLANNTVLISRDGSEYVIADSAAPIFDFEKDIIGVVLVFRDVTEKRRMENEILKIEKLESLGVLAGGIAHDFNNFLAGIIGNLSLAKLDISSTDVVYPRLEEMEKAALRAKDLTQQLLTFSKGGDPVKRTAELTHLVKEAALFALRGSNVRCDFIFQAKSLVSEVDESQISQVIHNLILNADQAMPEGGVVQIRGEIIKLPSNNAFSLNAGDYVKLAIQDQGIGIKKEQLKKVFDPYFTTKQRGSGLGLAVVYSIIDKHDGRITIDSELGEGATFSIYLPVAQEIEPKLKDAKTLIESGVGHILVMDDEDFIRKLASDMLRKIGYTVKVAKDGEEAIQLYKQAIESGQAFDAVILDLTIPGGMGGKETIQQLLLIDENVKAIVSSGYSNDPAMSNHSRYGFKKAVKKPYLIQEISEALQSVIQKSMEE
jgi:PAS domain S-box-containing protein